MGDWLPQLDSPALATLVASAGLLVLVVDWRISYVALALEYVAVAVLLTRVIAVPDVPLVKLIVGGFVVLILVVTGRRFNFGRSWDSQAGQGLRFHVPTGLVFRLLATIMITIVGAYLAGQPRLTLPGLQGLPEINAGSYLLMALAVLNLGLTEEPMNAGMALLTLINGFQLIYIAVEPSLAIVALMAGVEFAVAVAVSYLVAQQNSLSEEGASG